MILFVDACARKNSRTRVLAEHLLEKLGGEAEVLKLYDEELPNVTEDYINMRSAGSFDDASFRFAKQFAEADAVLIAAPFWDLSFPSVLKRYIEAICVTGITFTYSDAGIPVGMCRAKKLYYVTTSGGPIFSREFGFGYISALASGFFGIADCEFISAENLDIAGNDPSAILEDAKKKIDDRPEFAGVRSYL